MNRKEAEEIKAEVTKLVARGRVLKVKEIQSNVTIGPSEWDAVDLVMGNIFDDLMSCHAHQLVTLMRLISEGKTEIEFKDFLGLSNANIDSVVMISLLKAHFSVSEEHGRQVNDAHLHLDRVIRAAETDSDITLAIIGV